jgi:hypothetical protein
MLPKLSNYGIILGFGFGQSFPKLAESRNSGRNCLTGTIHFGLHYEFCVAYPMSRDLQLWQITP